MSDFRDSDLRAFIPAYAAGDGFYFHDNNIIFKSSWEVGGSPLWHEMRGGHEVIGGMNDLAVLRSAGGISFAISGQIPGKFASKKVFDILSPSRGFGGRPLLMRMSGKDYIALPAIHRRQSPGEHVINHSRILISIDNGDILHLSTEIHGSKNNDDEVLLFGPVNVVLTFSGMGADFPLIYKCGV